MILNSFMMGVLRNQTGDHKGTPVWFSYFSPMVIYASQRRLRTSSERRCR